MNIVFDLGGVVVNWLPDKLAATAFADPEQQQLCLDKIIGHPDWLALDRGSITLDQAIKNAHTRTGMSEESIADFFEMLGPSLTPIKDTVDLIQELSAAGEHPLFVLSNMHHAAINYLEANHDFWHLFRSTTISCRIGMLKPDQEIYEYLLTSNSLIASETVFIDDMPQNTQAAAKLGIKGLTFKSTKLCRHELKQLGCL